MTVTILTLTAGLQSNPFTMAALYEKSGEYTSKTRTLYAYQYAHSFLNGQGSPCTMIIASANLIKDGKPVKDAPIIGNSCVSFGFENPENYSKSMAASIKEVQFEVVDFLNKSFKPSGFEEM